MKKICLPRVNLVILVLLISVFTGCTSIVKTVMFRHPKAKSVFNPPPLPVSKVTGKAWLDRVGDGTNTITVLHLTTDDYYSQGFHHGWLLGTNVKSSVEDVLLGAEKIIPKGVQRILGTYGNRSLVNSILDKAWKLMEPYAPQQDLDEMQGLADGLKAAGIKGVDIKTIHRVHAIPDLSETSCSALIACGSATSDGHVYQMRVLDYGGEFNLHKRPLITVYHPTKRGENAYINIGWIGFIGLVSGMNESGVAISEMGYGNPPGEMLEGIPMPFLLKQILRNAGNANEARVIVQTVKRNNSYAYWLGDPDGHAIGMLTNARECVAFKINEQGTLSDGTNSIPQFKDVIYAGHYNEKQGTVVKHLQGNLDVPNIQKMAREIAMPSNLHTVIYDLTTRDVWVANRHGANRAADCTFVLFPYSLWK